jgi:hypothetical protein
MFHFHAIPSFESVCRFQVSRRLDRDRSVRLYPNYGTLTSHSAQKTITDCLIVKCRVKNTIGAIKFFDMTVGITADQGIHWKIDNGTFGRIATAQLGDTERAL